MSGTLIGQVALIEDDYTLVINRGADAGVVAGMVFAVYSGAPQVITDPESGRELGRLNREKLRVRVFDVAPLFARAHTFVDTGDLHGLLELPFFEQPHEDVVTVTVDVGDGVELVSAQSGTQRATGTHE
ncbi:hypothetical protein [Mycolicibacterium diernhoferi]|uniref:Uncharacterized protein n=1 Tax=Mycolicibacterium diernhoferi TaxID=1801 RepID=A0A1Q4H9J7_9MYCO|nr:hypothetical protein [Mycolicibacterium diernhoferi]OJZ64226.1 hypothetical protein BRW64_19235 [Mycolicibacterium diernhoferi]OPE55963.1 hypothetical protein BV510_02280 [Mycolicibacterium diernhoferi]PEG52820.1 hypothetical protein CRI78_19485 [Mycolicibacterium diernhoferi]QYL21816.1 hypothetical protein K0O62_22950 [Mycolicibacterium diernhoferi]